MKSPFVIRNERATKVMQERIAMQERKAKREGAAMDAQLMFLDGVVADRKQAQVEKARKRRTSIRQIGGDDGYQFALFIDGKITYNGMTRSEAKWRRDRFVFTGKI